MPVVGKPRRRGGQVGSVIADWRSGVRVNKASRLPKIRDSSREKEEDLKHCVDRDVDPEITDCNFD